MDRFRISLLFLLLFFCANKLTATSITATQSGNWNQTDTWGGLAVPDGTPCYDTIIIPAGITVTITVTVNLNGCPPVAVLVSGALNFQTGKKLDLSTGSFVYLLPGSPGGQLQSGGGGGSSNLITIGGTAYWSAGCTGSPPPDCGTMTGPDILCASCALPIELINFDANISEGVVYLNWQTASEVGNDYFWVQRSADGFVWENILWMDGAGNSSSLLSYALEDRSPLLGMSYYRLKQVDDNGAHSFSEIEVISNGQFYSDQQLLVLPSSSDAQHNVVIYFAEPITGEVEIKIVNVSGAILYSQKMVLTDEKWVVISLDRPVSSGVYIVKANQLIEKVFFQ
jgi:hypothetical protein